jgi:hypothetical protein
MSSKKSSRKSSSGNHRSTLSLQKTEIIINVYDLLPVRLPTYIPLIALEMIFLHDLQRDPKANTSHDSLDD